MIRAGVGLFAVLVLASGCGTESATGAEPGPPKPYKTEKGPIPSRAPTKPPKTCPSSGASITAGPVEPAMGRRVMTVTVTNCRAEPLTLNGYPQIAVLDDKRAKLKVAVVHGSSMMAKDPGPRKAVLDKGESAEAAVAWSNTVEAGLDKREGNYLSVASGNGDAPVIWPEWLDLGTTAKIQLTAWS
jgi:hypothetical protein